jgi:hypothetical protein
MNYFCRGWSRPREVGAGTDGRGSVSVTGQVMRGGGGDSNGAIDAARQRMQRARRMRHRDRNGANAYKIPRR